MNKNNSMDPQHPKKQERDIVAFGKASWWGITLMTSGGLAARNAFEQGNTTEAVIMFLI